MIQYYEIAEKIAETKLGSTNIVMKNTIGYRWLTSTVHIVAFLDTVCMHENSDIIIRTKAETASFRKTIFFFHSMPTKF